MMIIIIIIIIFSYFNPSQLFPKQQMSDSSKLKDFADKNFKCDENGRKFSKGIENSVEKREIAYYYTNNQVLQDSVNCSL